MYSWQKISRPKYRHFTAKTLSVASERCRKASRKLTATGLSAPISSSDLTFDSHCDGDCKLCSFSPHCVQSVHQRSQSARASHNRDPDAWSTSPQIRLQKNTVFNGDLCKLWSPGSFVSFVPWRFLFFCVLKLCLYLAEEAYGASREGSCHLSQSFGSPLR